MNENWKICEITESMNEDGTHIRCVSGRIARHLSNEKQQEWIAFQFEIDSPIARNGALLRREILEKVSGIIDPLKMNFQRLCDQS